MKLSRRRRHRPRTNFGTRFLFCLCMVLGSTQLSGLRSGEPIPSEYPDLFRRQRRPTEAEAPFQIVGPLTNDLGIIQLVERQPAPPWLEVETEQLAFFTDNVFLTETNTRSSAGWNGWFSVDVVPYSTLHWIPRLTLEHQSYRFDRAASVDFDSQTVTLESWLALLEDRSAWWRLSYAYERMVSPHGDNNEFLKEGEVRSAFYWLKPLNQEDNLLWDASFALRYYHATPSTADRIEQEIQLALRYLPTPALTLKPFVEPEIRIYRRDFITGQGRTDLRVSGGLLLIWEALPFLDLVSEFRWVGTYSSLDGRDYSVLFPNAGIYASIGF